MSYYGIKIYPDYARLEEDEFSLVFFYEAINKVMTDIGFAPEGNGNLFASNISPNGVAPFKTDPVKMFLAIQKVLHEKSEVFKYCKSIKLILIEELGDLRNK